MQSLAPTLHPAPFTNAVPSRWRHNHIRSRCEQRNHHTIVVHALLSAADLNSHPQTRCLFSTRYTKQTQQRPRPHALSDAAAAGAADQPPAPSSYMRVVPPTALALLLCNMDRICMSVAIMPMATEFGWAPSVQGVVQSAFLWGYMANQLIGGSLADRYGGKVVMAWGVIWFSLASLVLPLLINPSLVAAGWTLPAVLGARALVGLGEGVALPAMNNLVATHIPPEKKATALGNCFTGFHCGNLVGLLTSPWLLVNYGWRALFLVFGLLGAPLALMWQAVVPEAVRGVRPAGGGERKQLSVGKMLSKGATWAIIIVNFVNHWGYFIYLNWMPSYFARTFSASLFSSSLFSFLPWLVMAVGSSISGVLADHLVNTVGLPIVTVRKLVQTIAFLVPAAALTVLSSPGISAEVAVIGMTAALGVTSLGQAGFVANMSDIAPRDAGKMFGLCNTFGTMAGILGVTAVGLIVEWTGSFELVFRITSGMYVVAVLVWNLLCKGEPMFE